MKAILCCIALLAYSFGYAQQHQLTAKEKEKHLNNIEASKEKGDALWDYDTVFKAGVPYCIVYKKDKGNLNNPDFSVCNLAGQELIYVSYKTYTDYTVEHAPNTATPTPGYYSYFFKDPKSIGEVPLFEVYKEVIKNNLIDSGKRLNTKAETLFVELNGRRYSTITPPPPPAPLPAGYIMADRNHNAGIVIQGSDIKQDGKMIGTIQYGEGAVNGITTKTMDIFLPNGTRVAQAYSCSNYPHTWSVTTFRDYYRNIVASQGSDTMDVLTYLIYAKYL